MYIATNQPLQYSAFVRSVLPPAVSTRVPGDPSFLWLLLKPSPGIRRALVPNGAALHVRFRLHQGPHLIHTLDSAVKHFSNF